MKLYLGGPMSGIPQFNYPAFNEAARLLRLRDYEVINPAEMDDDEVQAESLESGDGHFSADGTVAGSTWGDFLSADVKIVADEVDGVVLLDKWWNSRGARTEAFICINVDKPVFEFNGKDAVEQNPIRIMDLIYKHTLFQGDTKRYGRA